MANQLQERVQRLVLILGRIDSYINVANLKASFILAFDVLMVVTLLSYRKDVLNYMQPGKLSWLDDTVYYFVVVLTIMSGLCALKVAYAYLWSGNRPAEYASLIFFGSIKDISLDQYSKLIKEQSVEMYENDLIRQIHTLADATDKKFVWINRSIVCLIASLFALGILVVVAWFQSVFLA